MSSYTDYHKQYYENVVKPNPEKVARNAAYHAEWQRKNKDKLSAYRKERRAKKRRMESENVK